MDTKELNEYIKYYLKNDKTNRALMLTAPWGSGKTHYVKNELYPYLVEENLDYALISLYGLNSIKELNKNLYLELKFNKNKTNTEFKTTKNFIGKTIIKGVTSFFNISLKLDDEDYEKLYSSINLSNKLIIFDDIERSNIPLIEFLGYINNLVENDSVKILIITNENELIKYNINDKKEQILTPESAEYIKIKEKTVGDTIGFSPNYKDIIRNIFNKFKDTKLNILLKNKEDKEDIDVIFEIDDLMKNMECYNFRKLIYACQKVSDVFDKMEKIETYNTKYLKYIFMGTLAFCLKENFEELKWDYNDMFTSNELGFDKYPLYIFMYDYINFQSFDNQIIKLSSVIFENDLKQNKSDEYIDTLYYYYKNTEEDVKIAIDNILDFLKEKVIIPVEKYIDLGNYLIAVDSVINYAKIQECLNCMIDNISYMYKSDQPIYLASIYGVVLNDEEQDRFNKFKNDLNNEIKELKFNFNSSLKNLDKLFQNIDSFKQEVYENKGISSILSVDKFIDFIKTCTSKNIYKIRTFFQKIYEVSNISSICYNDIETLQNIVDKINEIKSSSDYSFDSIQKQELKWFVNELLDIIKRLKR